ncbi:MAG: T9SS type A sorting domain-containing protein [Ignavibacteria bacterium]|nr:T9SS type A sorting domain-containing protein [Ignavibacteria bacterium]
MLKRLLIFLLPFISYSQGWYIQTTFSPAQSLQTIRFYNENTGYTTAPLYNGSNYNIHKTTNAGANWIDQNSGYTSMRFMAIWLRHPDTVYMSGNDGKIIRTINGGTNWVTVHSETGLQLWGLYFVNQQTGFASGSTGRIMKTTNAGVNWFNLSSPTQTSLNSIYFINENTGFISGFAIALKTTNQGDNWINMNAPFISGFENFREIYFFNVNLGLYVSDAGRIVKTTNSGANWTVVNSGTTQSLFGVYFTDAMTGFACGNSGAIVRTTDGGDNWLPQISPLNEILTDVWFTTASTGYISSWSGKILKTTNGGITFLSQTGTEVPADYSLEQNYPNPFNPVTNINFTLPERTFAEIRIYDLTGKLTEVLFSKELSAGSYTATWNAENYSSGVYFYSLLTNKFTKTSKMILVK